MLNCGIYKITDVSTGKFYIGSSNDLKNRKSLHFFQLRNKKHKNIKLQRIFNKGRELNFSILFLCHEKELIFYEQKLLDGWKPKLNIAKVAGRPDPELIMGDKNPMKRFDVIEKHKASVPRGASHPFYGMRGKLNNMNLPGVKEKHLKNIPRGIDNFLYGKSGDKNFMSNPSVREKQKNNVPRGCNHYKYGKGHLQAGAKNHMAKRVIEVNLGKIFDTLTDAAKYAGVSRQSIRLNCIGKLSSVKGKIFVYLKDYKLEAAE